MSSAQYEKVEDEPEPAAEETEQKEDDTKTEESKEDAPLTDTQDENKDQPPPAGEEQQQKDTDDQGKEEAAKPTPAPAAQTDVPIADQTDADIHVYKPPSTWLIMSIVVLIIFPFHVFFGVNLFFSIMTHRHIKNDNLKEAKKASKMALQLNGIAILLGVITYIGFLGMAFYV